MGNKVTIYKYNKNDELRCTDIPNMDTKEDSVIIYKYNWKNNIQQPLGSSSDMNNSIKYSKKYVRKLKIRNMLEVKR